MMMMISDYKHDCYRIPSASQINDGSMWTSFDKIATISNINTTESTTMDQPFQPQRKRGKKNNNKWI